MPLEIKALIVFVACYLFILSERVHRTIIAIIGASLLVILGIFTQEEAISYIDFNTIGLLIGMMIIVSIMRKTGVFQYMAIKIAQKVKGRPMSILLGLTLLTAVSSALLDNVTTVLLLTPLIFVITSRLKINPVPFLVSEILAANIGGSATLIGDPPNIIIGSAANLSFMDFVINLSPVAIVIFFVIMSFLKIIYRKELKYKKEYKKVFDDIDASLLLEDRKLLRRSIFVLCLVLLGFLTHGMTHIQPAAIALFGAGLLLFLGSFHPEESLKRVEWPIIFFFVGLFVLVGSLEHTGVIRILAEKAILLTNGNTELTTYLILWFSGIFSGFIDNIPFVATMIPLIKDMGSLTQMDITPFWWALALGADLGGNMTLVGASSNLVVASQCEKNSINLGFIEYMKIGAFVTFISLLIATAYLGLFVV